METSMAEENRAKQQDDFRTQAAAGRAGLISEFVDFLKENKKWWLAPIILSMLGLGLLVLLAGSAGAPFIYTLF